MLIASLPEAAASRIRGDDTGRRPALLRRGTAVLAVTAVCWWIGKALESGAQGEALVVFLAGLTVVVVIGSAAVRQWSLNGILSVEAPIILLLMSSLVLRQRSTEELAYDPLDPAAQFRVACVALALMLAGIALVSPPSRARVGARATASLPFFLCFAYVWVVFLGAIFASRPTLTAYRGVELLAALLAIAGGLRHLGRQAVRRMLAPLLWFCVGLITTVWLTVLLAFDHAVDRVESPLPWQLHGAYPVLSSNGVGTVGTIVFLWSLARLWSGYQQRTNPRVDGVLAVAGLVTLIAAQYRTGYIGAVVGVVVLMGLRRRALLWIAGISILLLVATGSMASLTRSVEPLALRGQSWERATELSGRFNWWHAALPVWRESPLIGRGLLTATRFEVLERQGLGTTSTIHGTWIEALVGTGVIGVALLGTALLVGWRRALVLARSRGDAVPLVLLTFLLVRSLTGPTIEVFGHAALLFLVLSLVTEVELSEPARPAPSSPHPLGIRPTVGTRQAAIPMA